MKTPFNEVIDGEVYSFECVLGKGAFGTVYKCRRPSGRTVAVKKILNFRATMEEAQVLMKLRGPEYEPHFVQCLKVYRNLAAIYLVMEYCPDGTLEMLVRKLGKLEFREASHYFAQLIVGIKKLHGIGLMHRDLKPANILVARRADNSIRTKIADFGISKAVPNRSIYQTLCGTPFYMAPEIREGHRYDKSADVYSLGAIMYFMLRGRHPSWLKFDRCGYPFYPDRPIKYAHTSLSGRMMCRRKEERLALDEIEIRSGNKYILLNVRFCAICGRKLAK